MAAKKTPLPPPSPESRDALLGLVRAAAEPVLAKPLIKLLPPPLRMTEADAVRILNEGVHAGVLYVAPPKTAKGHPRFWGQDVRAIGRTAALNAIDQAEQPVTAKKLAGQLRTPVKFTEPDVAAFLEHGIEIGRVYSLPPATAKGAPRYWKHDVWEFGRQELLRLLDTKGPQADAKLRTGAKGLSAAQVEQVLQNMIAAGDLWRHPPLRETGKELFGRKPPSPEPYLREIGAQLAKIVAQLAAAKVPPADLRRAVVQVVEAAGIRFGTGAAAMHESAPSGDAIDLIGLIKRIEPGAERGALIGSRDLRRAAQLRKPQFDQAVLELARQGRLSLHRHDYAASLTPDERNELVSDGQGTYYVGMALRQRDKDAHRGNS